VNENCLGWEDSDQENFQKTNSNDRNLCSGHSYKIVRKSNHRDMSRLFVVSMTSKLQLLSRVLILQVHALIIDILVSLLSYLILHECFQEVLS
jgi:hypothetical protein